MSVVSNADASKDAMKTMVAWASNSRREPIATDETEEEGLM